MSLPNIILWSISLILSMFSIMFASWAAYSASKANTRLRDTISAEWITNETTKLFFDQIKDLQKYNLKTITALEKSVTYKEYTTHSTHTRFKIIPKISQRILAKTNYSELTKKYIEFKRRLDQQFVEEIDLKLLSSSSEIPATTKKKLIKYHKQITAYTKELLSDYVVESSR